MVMSATSLVEVSMAQQIFEPMPIPHALAPRRLWLNMRMVAKHYTESEDMAWKGKREFRISI